MIEAKRLAQDSHRRLDLAQEYILGMNERLMLLEERTAAGSLTKEQAKVTAHYVMAIQPLPDELGELMH